MKTTYTRTLFIEDLSTAKISLYTSKESRYGAHEFDGKIERTGLASWTIIEGGQDALDIEKFLGEEDENGEYLVFKFVDGHTEIYRNSHVTMFMH